MNNVKFGASALAIVFGALIVLGSFFGAFYTVDEGERAVIVRNGQVTGVSEPGLHFKLPFITTAHTMTIRNEAVAYTGLEAYTTDQQIATIEAIHIGYRIPADRVEEVYREFKTPSAVVDRYVGRRVNAELEKVFGQFSAERSIKERSTLSAEVAKALKSLPEGVPLEILSVEIDSFSYPDSYTARINERMTAEIEVTKKKQEVLQAEQDKQKAQHEADARAYEVKAQADAAAHAIKVRGEAEADAIRLRTEALADNPALIELTKAERWDGVLPTTMLPGGATPMLSIR